MFERPSRCAVGAALLWTLAAGTAAAEDYGRDSYVTYAEVVSVTPYYGWREIEEPVRYCEDVPVRRSYDRHARYGAYRYGPSDYGFSRDGFSRDGFSRYDPAHDARDGYGHDRWNDGRRRGDGSEAAAGLVGGLIGGLVGHQFGGGNGKKALTIVGAALGASIAQDHVRRSRDQDHYGDRYDDGFRNGGARYGTGRVTRHCRETVETRRVRGVQGYDVTYRYQGRTFNKWMDEHPGDRVRVHVDVDVAPEDGLALR